MSNADNAEAEKVIAEVEQADAEQDKRLREKARKRTLVIKHESTNNPK